RPLPGLAASAGSRRGATGGGLGRGEGAFGGGSSAGGRAGRAGVRYGDVVPRVGGRGVAGAADVGDAVAGRHPGDDGDVEIVRADGTRESVLVTLGARPAKTP